MVKGESLLNDDIGISNIESVNLQRKEVSGVIVDEMNVPVAGATITVKIQRGDVLLT